MVFRKTLNKFCLRKFGPSHSRYVPPVSRAPASELVLQRGGLPSEIALQGGTLESKIAYRRVDPDFEKIFSAHNDQVDMNRGKKWFSEKL